jgi:anti-anti-sigma factor
MLRYVTPYEIEVPDQEREGLTVVALAGELDLTNAAEIERRLGEIAPGGLVLDLNRVIFVDSAALHMLFRLARRFGNHQRFGIVIEPTALIARTLAIVGLNGVTSVRPTVDELVAEPTP